MSRAAYVGANRVLQVLAQGQSESAAGVTVAAVWLLVTPILLIGMLVEVLRGGNDASALLSSALMMGASGLIVVRLSRVPRTISAVQLFAAVVSGTCAAVVALMVPHLLTETVLALDEAFIEAAAAVSGTNVTLIDPATLSDGMATVRALSQWACAAGLIVVVVRVLPHLGVGGLDADGGVATRSARRLSPRVGGTLYRLLVMYMGFTVVMGMAFLVAGMPVLDSGLHALTTVSTGGFSSNAESIGGYGSAAVEWVAIGGMLTAGCSLPLLFLALRRRDPRRFLRSFEFRVYVVLISFAAFAIVVWSDAELTTVSVRHAIFAATSAVSTTGFTAGSAAAIPAGGQMILVLLMAVGGMAASVAGGYKVVRMMALAAYIRREMIRSLHPDAVQSVHMGSSSIGEVALSRIVGELLLSVMVLGVAFVVLAQTGLDPVGAVSFAVSAYANVGPAFGDLALRGHVFGLNAAGHVAAGLLMLIGRVSVTPVLVTFGMLFLPMVRSMRLGRRRVRADTRGPVR